MTLPSLTSFKVCPRCECTKPAITAFFARAKKGRYGLQSWCKVCAVVNNRRHFQENKAHRTVQRRAYYEANRERMREYHREWYETNKERILKKAREDYEQNRDAILARSKAWKVANPERVRQMTQEWQQANREHLSELARLRRERDPERYREHSRQWAKRNPEAVRQGARSRRARVCNAEGSFTLDDVWDMLEAQGHLCAWCETPLMGEYHVDHFVPLVKGGTNGAENLCVACPPCNARKQAMMPLKFLKRLGYNVVNTEALGA